MPAAAGEPAATRKGKKLYTFTRASICSATSMSYCEILSRNLRTPLERSLMALACAAGASLHVSAVHVPTCRFLGVALHTLFHGVMEAIRARCPTYPALAPDLSRRLSLWWVLFLLARLPFAYQVRVFACAYIPGAWSPFSS